MGLTNKINILDNCQFFTNRQADSRTNGNSMLVPGIYANVMNFFNNRGLTVGTGVTLT